MQILNKKLSSMVDNRSNIELPVNVILSRETVEAFVERTFSPEMKEQRDIILNHPERYATQEAMNNYAKPLAEEYARNLGLVGGGAKQFNKAMELLTVYGWNMNPVRSETIGVPRMLLHVLAIPHGAADGLVMDLSCTKFSELRVLVNFKAKKDTASQEGIGGHKKYEKTFEGNMADELTEELYTGENAPEDIKARIRKEKIEPNMVYVGDRTINPNYAKQDGQINIHVSDLYILKTTAMALEDTLPEESSKGYKWVTFEEAQQIAQTEDGFFFGILWNNLVKIAKEKGFDSLSQFISTLRTPAEENI